MKTQRRSTLVDVGKDEIAARRALHDTRELIGRDGAVVVGCAFIFEGSEIESIELEHAGGPRDGHPERVSAA